ncbi:hypothetical protein QJS10_CPB14g01350 [Acorus calamus]|uniref:Reverse transcriptase n=1 Tax=Acorus calamus TaxID=4465 RepID=A0AAV9D9D5_ACOCL|nr:hypothetical protein QJS10_CPB14g01350 [Acorus calamus]
MAKGKKTLAPNFPTPSTSNSPSNPSKHPASGRENPSKPGIQAPGAEIAGKDSHLVSPSNDPDQNVHRPAVLPWAEVARRNADPVSSGVSAQSKLVPDSRPQSIELSLEQGPWQIVPPRRRPKVKKELGSTLIESAPSRGEGIKGNAVHAERTQTDCRNVTQEDGKVRKSTPQSDMNRASVAGISLGPQRRQATSPIVQPIGKGQGLRGPTNKAKETGSDMSKALVLVEKAVNRASKKRVLETPMEDINVECTGSPSSSNGRVFNSSSKALEFFQKSLGVLRRDVKRHCKFLIQAFSLDVLILIETHTQEEPQGVSWLLVGVYASPDAKVRQNVWIETSEVLKEGLPTLIVGDFNTLLGPDDKRGGAPFRVTTEVRMFRQWDDDNQLQSIEQKGQAFTWCNNRKGSARTWEVLDRAFANQRWLHEFPTAITQVLPRQASDHSPVILHSVVHHPTGHKPFRMERFWFEYSDFPLEVAQEWRRSSNGSPLVNFHRKLIKLQFRLRNWNRERVGNLQYRLQAAHSELEQLGLNEPCYGDDPGFQKKLRQTENYVNALERQNEVFWAQRSRQQWIKDGDRNTRFFQASVHRRRSRNRILMLKGPDGHVYNSPEDVHNYIRQHFESHWTARGVQADALQSGLVHSCISDIEAAELVQPFSDQEIEQVVRSLPCNKAPGPDGYPSEFYRHFWHMLKEDFTRAINDFFVNARLPLSWGSTHIVLIPKIEEGFTEADWRRTRGFCSPKINSWPLAPDTRYNAFNASQKGRNALMMLKVDFASAYDSVEWDSLIQAACLSPKVAGKLDALARKFLWHGDDQSRKIHYVAWEQVSLPYASNIINLMNNGATGPTHLQDRVEQIRNMTSHDQPVRFVKVSREAVRGPEELAHFARSSRSNGVTREKEESHQILVSDPLGVHHTEGTPEEMLKKMREFTMGRGLHGDLHSLGGGNTSVVQQGRQGATLPLREPNIRCSSCPLEEAPHVKPYMSTEASVRENAGTSKFTEKTQDVQSYYIPFTSRNINGEKEESHQILVSDPLGKVHHTEGTPEEMLKKMREFTMGRGLHGDLHSLGGGGNTSVVQQGRQGATLPLREPNIRCSSSPLEEAPHVKPYISTEASVRENAGRGINTYAVSYAVFTPS